MRSKIRFMIITVMFLLLVCPLNAYAEGTFMLSANCQSGQMVKITVSVDNYENVADGYDIFRFNPMTGEYDLLGNMDLMENGYDYYMDYDAQCEYEETGKLIFSYDITDVHIVGETYIYQVKSYRYDEDFDENWDDSIVTTERNKNYIDTVETTVTILKDGPKITYGKRSGKLNVKLKWEKDETADGYLIYYVKNYTDKSKWKSVDVYDESSYTLVNEINNNKTTSTKIKNLMNGVTYTYRICSYRMVDGQQVTSMMSEPKSVLMNYYSYNGETYQQKIKRAFGSEKKKKKNFATSSKAAKQMKIIKIKVWDFKNGKKGKKVTRTKYLTVNKRLAPSIKVMFDEIYKAKEKQVIKDIGCYSYRTGEHMYGMAIDINPNENYMIDGDTILAGSFWKPKKSKYSIPLNCETVRIMERYGFYRGFWGDRKDYMHFSYFGT